MSTLGHSAKTYVVFTFVFTTFLFCLFTRSTLLALSTTGLRWSGWHGTDGSFIQPRSASLVAPVCVRVCACVCIDLYTSLGLFPAMQYNPGEQCLGGVVCGLFSRSHESFPFSNATPPFPRTKRDHSCHVAPPLLLLTVSILELPPLLSHSFLNHVHS